MNERYLEEEAVPKAQLNFLMDVLGSITDNGADPQIIYPLFQANLPYLNERLIPLLLDWQHAKFAEVDDRERESIVAVLVNFANLIQQFPLGRRLINLEIAIHCYRLALDVYTQEAFPEAWAMTQMNLANAYSDRIRGERAANLEAAIECCRLALDVYTQEAFPKDWAGTQMNLAAAYRNRIRGERAANLEAAIECCRLALDVYTQEVFPEDWAMTQNNLATAYRNRIEGDKVANLEAAVKCCWLALDVYTQEAFPEAWARTQVNLANAYRNRIEGDKKANLEAAVECCRLALDVYTQEAFPEAWARTQVNLAKTYQKVNRFAKAINCFQSALEIHKPELLPIDCLKTSQNLGNLASAQGDWELAISAYDLAIQAVETSRSWADSDKSRQEILRDSIYVYQNAIQSCINSQRIDLAIQYSERARSRQLVDFMATRDLYADGKIPAEVAAYLAEYYELERQLVDFMATRDLYADGKIPAEVAAYLAEYYELERQIHELQIPPSDNSEHRQLAATTRNRAALAAASELIAELEAKKYSVWQKIRAYDPVFAEQKQVTPIDIATIQSLITNSHTAILSFYTTDNDTHIFILTHNNQPQIHTCQGQGLESFQLWLGENWLQPYIEDRQQWQSSLPDTLSEITRRLELDSLIAKLPKIKELIVIPHLFLHQIPIAALPIAETERGKKYLGDLFTIRYAPSCQILQYCVDRSPGTVTQYGTVENADGSLPGAGYEGERVATLFKISSNYRLQGRERATIDNFISLLKQPISHCLIANHAQSRLDNPHASGLQFADGDFQLDRLLISRFPHLQEIFLSCCETHLGFGDITDDLLTLGTGFLCAGARTVISTLWAVDDLATALFSIFYYNNRHQGIDRAKALKMAQVRLRKLSGEEFKLNHAEDLRNHLTAYARQIQSERKAFDPKTNQEQFDRLTEILNKTLDIRKKLDDFSTLARPFEEPFYWAAFTCQGLA